MKPLRTTTPKMAAKTHKDGAAGKVFYFTVVLAEHRCLRMDALLL
ncbi:hypothetical protein [Specibacter sp. NPDC078709]